MTIRTLMIVKTPRTASETGTYAVVTGVRVPVDGEAQVFLRTLDTGKPLQTTEQFLEYGTYEIVGMWSDPSVKETVTTVIGDVNVEALVADDDLPVY